MIDKFKKTLKYVGIFIGLIIGMLIFDYIPLWFFNIDIDKFSDSMRIIYLTCCSIGFMAIMFLIYKDVLINDFKEYFKNFGKNMETSFKYYFAGAAVMYISNLLIGLLTSANAGNENAVRDMISNFPIYMVFQVSLYAPFVEELIFRKSIRDCFYKKETKSKVLKYSYAVVSGLIFSLMHIIGSANAAIDYLYVIPYFGLGFSFGLLYTKSNNIFSSMSMHCVHNTFAVIIYLMLGL